MVNASSAFTTVINTFNIANTGKMVFVIAFLIIIGLTTTKSTKGRLILYLANVPLVMYIFQAYDSIWLWITSTFAGIMLALKIKE